MPMSLALGHHNWTCHHNWTDRLRTGRAASTSSLLAQLATLGISAFVIGAIGSGQPAVVADPFTETPTSAGESSDAGPIVPIIQPSYAALLKGKEQIVIGVQPRKYPANAIEMYVDDVMATPGAVPLDAVPQ